jgi:hypothetical protein
VSPHLKWKKHLKESTKVDAEYHLPTWIPKSRVNMTKQRIPIVDPHVDHAVLRVPNNAPSIIIINQGTYMAH